MAHHIAIQGGLGAGKTLVMSILAHWWRAKVKRKGHDIQLFSNYNLKDSLEMVHYTDWYEVTRRQGSIVCWDEAHNMADSRQYRSKESINMTKLLFYTRKMKSVQMYATPSVMNLDSRIRQIVEILLNVRNVGHGVSIDVYDYQMKEAGAFGKYRNTLYLPNAIKRKFFKLNLYDTYEMVQQFPMPSTEKQAQKFFEELQRIHDDVRKEKKIKIDKFVEKEVTQRAAI